jgi:hypothetical protein
MYNDHRPFTIAECYGILMLHVILLGLFIGYFIAH